MSRPAREDELHAYADDRLPPERRREVERWLAEHPEFRERIEVWRSQNAQLHEVFDAVLDEPVPARLTAASTVRKHLLPRMAAAVAWLALGVVLGFLLRGQTTSLTTGSGASLPRQAAIAHAVYAPEVRHPVEVGAEQQNHLVGWLSNRLGTQLNPPRLNALGFELVGGRLLPGNSGPVAQFMYQDARGQRLTLYVRTEAADGQETAFRFAREGSIGVFYWLDGSLGYALSGELPRNDLLKVATEVYRQLNP